MSSYGFSTRLAKPFDDAVAKVTAALKAEGFGVLTEIDVRATFKKKLDADFRPYVILGACNPQLAKRALDEDLGVGLLLPCNVVIWEENGAAVVSIADPRAMFQIVDNRALQPIADEAERRLRAAFAAIKGS